MTKLLSPEPVQRYEQDGFGVRGRDHGHFVPEHRLRQALSQEDRQQHREALAAFRALRDAGFSRPVSAAGVP